MKVNGVNSYKQSFGGLVSLVGTQEFKNGFPHNPDSIDYFQYIPFADEPEEKIEKEINILKDLNEGPKPFEIGPDKFIMKESAIEVKRMEPIFIHSKEFEMNKRMFPRSAFNLSEIAQYELKSRIAYLKKSLEKIPIDNLSNEVAKYFRWK